MTTIVIPKDPGFPGLFPFPATSPDCPGNSDIQEHYGAIIGRGGQTLKSIHEETGARIIIPRNDGPIRITGTIPAINAAKMKIQSISMEQTMFKERREPGIPSLYQRIQYLISMWTRSGSSVRGLRLSETGNL